jgi:hypothetical protein
MSSGVLPRLGNIFGRVVRRVQQSLYNVKFLLFMFRKFSGAYLKGRRRRNDSADRASLASQNAWALLLIDYRNAQTKAQVLARSISLGTLQRTV